MTNLTATYEAARAAVLAGEAANLSDRTMNKRYKALHTAIDALKNAGVW